MTAEVRGDPEARSFFSCSTTGLDFSMSGSSTGRPLTERSLRLSRWMLRANAAGASGPAISPGGVDPAACSMRFHGIFTTFDTLGQTSDVAACQL